MAYQVSQSATWWPSSPPERLTRWATRRLAGGEINL